MWDSDTSQLLACFVARPDLQVGMPQEESAFRLQESRDLKERTQNEGTHRESWHCWHDMNKGLVAEPWRARQHCADVHTYFRARDAIALSGACTLSCSVCKGSDQ